MRKSYTLSIVLLLISTFSFAQLRVGILGGANIASVNETNSLPNWDTYKNGYSNRSGLHFGIQGDIPFSSNSMLFFQPAVIYNNKGRKFSETYDTTVSNIRFFNATQYVDYIDFPLNLVLKLKLGEKSKFFIGGGPYLSFFYNGSEKSETFFKNGTFKTEENTDLPVGKGPGKYEVLNYGVNGTAGFEIGKVFLSGKYAAGLNDFYSASNYSGTFKHQVISATLGVYIGKPVSLETKVSDRDHDGVPDDKDLCPDEAGSALTNGCPDRDGDGIPDKADKCPDVAGLLKNNGCPDVTDTDGDGIPDTEDKCPNIAGSKKYGGCPVPDSDQDGINDEEDKCPDIAGPKENGGCPVKEINKETIDKVNLAASKIQFTFASSEIQKSAYEILDEVAEVLNSDPSLKLSIEGHTSSDGNYDANIRLSAQRAEAVKNYLVSKGIAAERMTTKGFGPDKPLNKNKTTEAQIENRRVELILSN